METEHVIMLFWALAAYVVVLIFRKKRQRRMIRAAPSLYSEHVDNRFWKRFFLTLFVFMPAVLVVSLFFGIWEWSPLSEEVKGTLVLIVIIGGPLAFPLALAIAWVWNSWRSTAKPMTHAEAPTTRVDPLTGKVTVKHLSRKVRRKERAFAMRNFDRERRGLPRLHYGDERDAEIIRATGE